jgi:PKD repeat protein
VIGQAPKLSVGLTVSNDNPAVNTAVTFTVSASLPGNPAGSTTVIQSVQVDFGDGSTASLGASGTTVTHTYRRTGDFTAIATVTDNNGQSERSAPLIVSVK